MWHWSGFITTTSLHSIFTFFLLQVLADGQQEILGVGYGCALPHLWDVPHILASLDRAATPPHTPCSPTCSGFCVCPWRWWHRPGPCLPSSRTLPCYVYHNYIYGTMHSFCWNRPAFLWAHLMWSLSFWMYLVEVGAVINSEVNPRVMLMGSQGCLLYMKKQGLKPKVELQAQL